VAEPTLSTRELNRALLARQLLLERSSLPLVEALEQVGGLQTQYAPSAYIGLWSRLRGFRRESLTAALHERQAIQATLMRSTIHVVSAADYWPLVAGTRRARREWWERAARSQLGGIDPDAVASRVREHLRDGPRRHAEMLKLLEADGWPRIAWTSAGSWVEMVRVPPSGTWEQRRADLYGLAGDWLPDPGVPETEGHELLVSRYLGGFGPAAVADIASWAGVPSTTLRPVVERLELRRFRDEAGRKLVDLPDAPLPDGETPAPVRFLPTWDATLLVHARRTLILPEEYRPRIFHTKAPQSYPTLLVDGAVAGTWRYEEGRIVTTPFHPLSPTVQREVDEEGERLAAWYA
jgi:hypothetical protein